MEIKSATLLPRQETNSDGSTDRSAAAELADPRQDLIQKLLAYKRFKESSELLDQRRRQHEARFPSQPAATPGQPDEPPPVDLEEVQVWDLLAAFNRLLTQVGARKPRFHEVVYDDTPIDLHAADIEDRLRRDGRLTLAQLVIGRTSRSEMIGVFLALLELIRQKKVVVTQNEALGEIEIDPAPPEHRATAEAEPGAAPIDSQ